MTSYSDFSNRKSLHLQNHNYSGTGNYFITICTKFCEHYFGEIINNHMHLNDLGNEVVKQWLQTVELRPDMKITLDEFQVMSNHFHGIIEICWNKYNNTFIASKISSPEEFVINSCTDAMHCVRTGIDNETGNKFGPQRKNLGSIMRGFKSSITTFARKNQILFDWHTRYFDIVIKDEIALAKIRRYIRNNPKNWNRDRFKQ